MAVGVEHVGVSDTWFRLFQRRRTGGSGRFSKDLLATLGTSGFDGLWITRNGDYGKTMMGR